MTLSIPFDNSFARLSDSFYTKLPPQSVRAPALLAFNHDLAAILGISAGDVEEMAQVFGGNTLPEGADPLAQLYAGHQFGNWNPQLGDGRAILLGEVIGTDGQRRDIQLKGSGRTPYSRGGDGRAWVGPVLREFVVSEAMHALGIPTTRALAAVATGETIRRETLLPGAVLTRVAASHLRVGTFQIFAARGQVAELRQLTDYAIARHYPDADGPMGLLRAVARAQTALIPAWMSVGFIHGVMNTDNCTISGETIDYGPCAFLDEYQQDRVFSSIDRGARYAYGNQPEIVVWNLAQLATALIQQFDDPQAAVEEATEIVHAMPAQMEANWLARFRAKIGLETEEDGDMALISGLLARMQADRADFTNSFAALGAGAARDQFVDRDAFDRWQSDWQARVSRQNGGMDRARAIMAGVNPLRIPRNHRMEEMISAAVEGEMQPFTRLMAALSAPFEARAEWEDLSRAPTAQEIVPATFCGT